MNFPRLISAIWIGCILIRSSAAAYCGESLPPTSNSSSNSTQFVRLSRDARGEPLALETAIVRYTAPAKGKSAGLVVDLVGAVHVGEKGYYQRLENEFGKYDVVLYELVAPTKQSVAGGALGSTNATPNATDRPTPSPAPEPAFVAVGALQRGMKDFLQLEHQIEHINYRRTNFVHADMTVAQFKETMASRGESFFSMFLALMIRSMAEQNQGSQASDLEILMALFNPNRALVMKRLMAEQFERLGGTLEILGGAKGSTILTERNKLAMDVLATQVAQGRKRIAIFYGAAHMPDFEARLAREFGMQRQSQRWFTAWDLRSKAQRAFVPSQP